MKTIILKRAAAVGCAVIALIGSTAGCSNRNSTGPTDLDQQRKEAMGSTPGPATLALIAEARAKARAQSAAQPRRQQ